MRSYRVSLLVVADSEEAALERVYLAGLSGSLEDEVGMDVEEVE